MKMEILLVILLLGFICAVVSAAVLSYERMQRQEKRKLIEMLHKEQENFRMLVSYERKANRFKHDLKNKVLGIQYLIREGRTEQAIRNLEETIQEYYDLDYDFTANQHIWNVIIGSKFAGEETGNIHLTKNIDLNHLGAVDEVDFGIIMGNLLDNALHAVKDERVQNKEVQITLTGEKGFVYLEIRNTYIEKERVRNETLWDLTAIGRELEHGFGLSNIQALVKKYNGKFDVSQEGEYYISRILLPCIEQKKQEIEK